MVNTNVNCRRCMLIRNIWCWTLDSKVEVSTSIYGGTGTPLVTQQLTWWFKVHLSQKAHVSRAMLISKLECWWTKFNVELSLIKLKSKVLTITLRTTKLNELQSWMLIFVKSNITLSSWMLWSTLIFGRDGTPYKWTSRPMWTCVEWSDEVSQPSVSNVVTIMCSLA